MVGGFKSEVQRRHEASIAVRGLKALEVENAKLKKLVAERDLEIDLIR